MVTIVNFDATIGAFKEASWNLFAYIVAMVILVAVLPVRVVSFAAALVVWSGEKLIHGLIQTNIGAKMRCLLQDYLAVIAERTFLLSEAKSIVNIALQVAVMLLKKYLYRNLIAPVAKKHFQGKKADQEDIYILKSFAQRIALILRRGLAALIKMVISSITEKASSIWNTALLWNLLLAGNLKRMKIFIIKMVCAVTTELKIWSCGARSNPKDSASKTKSRGVSNFFVNMVILSRAGQVTKFNVLD